MRYWTAAMERADALLFGRVTYEMMESAWRRPSSGAWPDWMGDREIPFAEAIDRARKYVVSSTLTDPEWDRTTVLSGDPVAAVQELKQQPGRDIVLTGSIRLGHALIAAGLVDEYRLFVYPVVQGRGRRLFPDGYEVPHLELVRSVSFTSGVALLVHRA